MRVSESRYTRDLRRIHLAQRMIKHEVRTQWICAWAGISDERVRNLVKSYDQTRGGVARHRGPCPKVFTPLLRTAAMRSEASGLAGLACALHLIPATPVTDARKALPGVELGERLIHAFELYQLIVPAAKLKMDHFILLVLTLAEGKQFEVEHCSGCQAAVLLESSGNGRRLCETCGRAAKSGAGKARAQADQSVSWQGPTVSRPVGPQQDFFRAPGGKPPLRSCQ